MSGRAPVGVFDSGVGGLSVAREIRARLPAEDLLYFADSANCPYGGRSLEWIRERSLAVGRELVARGAKLIVVACNTASGAALEVMRAELDVPIVGLEPAIKPATSLSRSGRVGVMATVATLQSRRFQRLLERFGGGVTLIPQACPGLVELVETGQTGGDRVRQVLDDLLAPLREADVDTVVLGCTHYPFLRDAVRDALGGEVRVIDSGRAVARQVERVLRERDALEGAGQGELRLLTTGDPGEVAEVARRLWGEPIPAEKV